MASGRKISESTLRRAGNSQLTHLSKTFAIVVSLRVPIRLAALSNAELTGANTVIPFAWVSAGIADDAYCVKAPVSEVSPAWAAVAVKFPGILHTEGQG